MLLSTNAPSTDSDVHGIADLVKAQRRFFASGETKTLRFRKEQLHALKNAMLRFEDKIHDALYADLRKSAFEAYGTETGFVYLEIDQALQNLERWMRPRPIGTPLFHFPGASAIHPDPYGVALIVAPWNYPFQLLVAPLVGAIAAGNTAVLKPSEYAEHTAAVLTEMIASAFDPAYVALVNGGPEVSKALLENRYDYIFFTGGTEVGRYVYQAAAKHLTPVTLELGGKSPCFVDKNVPIEQSAKRIVWGKLLNAGQTCIAPDYLLVHREIKDKLVEALGRQITEAYGQDPKASPDFGRIINDRHFARLTGYLRDGKVLFGGLTDATERYIGPTLIEVSDMESSVMREEIFGPILPIVAVGDAEEAIEFINARPKPLALYAFSGSDRTLQRFADQTSSGGVCFNDTIMHIANSELPFGGVGDSGIGGYHGKASFETFSHLKPVFKRSNLMDTPLRYAPYNKLGLPLLKKLMKWSL
jgi:aldehyde dehydrogenase (NAD+)